MKLERLLVALATLGGLAACAATMSSNDTGSLAVKDRSALTETLSLIADSATAVVGWRTFEQPDYDVLESDARFELRAYPELAVVRATDGESAAFGRLFRYLGGANDRDAKVAMTAPALVQDEAEGDETTMVFVLPKRYTTDTAPVPTDEGIVLETVEAATYAAVRFAGRATDERVVQQTAELRTWIVETGAVPLGEPMVAGYDPPFTLPSLRRNEVWIRVE